MIDLDKLINPIGRFKINIESDQDNLDGSHGIIISLSAKELKKVINFIRTVILNEN